MTQNSISTCLIYKIQKYIYLINYLGHGPSGLTHGRSPVPFVQVHDMWYPWYQISSATPECLASELYLIEPDLPALAKFPSALPELKLSRRVLRGSGQVLNDSDRVSSSLLKTRIGALSRCTY
jgi:hypothetical protein